MGWHGTPGKTKQGIIDEILDDFRSRDILKEHATAPGYDGDSILWSVVAGTTEQGEEYQYILCHLIQKNDDCWGYKPMDETMGPCYHSAPVEWLDKYPCVIPSGHSGYSDKWRAQVRSESLCTA